MRAVFLDRDGVINERLDGYVTCPEELRFLPGTLDALAALAICPFRIVIVTNQAGVGRGRMTSSALDQVHGVLLRQIEAANGRIDAVYACPHQPSDGCACRKPRPGLLQRAARDLAIDVRGSFFVGDAISDVQAARAVACRPIVVRTGLGAETQAELARRPDHDAWMASDLAHAVEMILDETGHRPALIGEPSASAARLRPVPFVGRGRAD